MAWPWIIAGVVGLVAISFWDEIKKWIRGVVKGIIAAIRGAVRGVKAEIERDYSGEFVERAKVYSQNDYGQWKETIKEKEIPASDVPEEFRNMGRGNYVDITEKLGDQRELING